MGDKQPHAATHAPKGSLPAIALGALGIVFGDIGTSPLYTLSLCIHGEHGAGTEAQAVLGVLSLIFWSLTMVVTVKYLVFVMRADNHGEGGILSLLALLPSPRREGYKVPALTLLVLVGAALLYGDGVITPAISVLSAVEGLGVATTRLQPYVVPLTCVILFGLFAIQQRGTAGIGRAFGPVMVVWFFTIGTLGALQIARAPGVLAALSPAHAATYLTTHGLRGPAILGCVVLSVTGGEALYADMGHFGAKPIRLAWILVFPALILSYFGQGALILSGGDVGNPFFAQVPLGPLTYALVGLSTVATVIASQALISGVFSLTRAATQLGMFPRVTVHHTSEHAEGQIYLPEINWALAVACVALVLGFRASDKLAAAYGIAESGAMCITSICFYNVARRTWGWPAYKAAPLLALFLMFDVPFFSANLVKLLDGGYVPVGIATAICALMLIWNRGRRLLAERNQELSMPEERFVEGLDKRLLARLPETTVFLAGPTEGIPRPMNQYASHLRVLGETVIVVTIQPERVPFIEEADRVEIAPIDAAAGVYRLIGHVGFMEDLDVPALLAVAAKSQGLGIDMERVSYVVARETLLATNAGKMGAVAESIYSFMLRNSPTAADSFCLPPDQVIELGTRVDL